MKITMNLQKLHRQDLVAISNHNNRSDGGHAEPVSVLPKALWFGQNLSHEYPGVIDHAMTLAKRKDAVIAQSFLFQVGNQDDWRNLDGTPKNPPPIDMDKFFKECMRFITEKYGSENIARYDLHLDESSPHLTVWVTPIKAGKLAQKSFIDGAKSMTIFRNHWEEKILSAFRHDHVSLERGVTGGGGQPHDQHKSTVLKNYLSAFPEPVEFQALTMPGGFFRKPRTEIVRAVPASSLERWKAAAITELSLLIDTAAELEYKTRTERLRAEKALKALKQAQDELSSDAIATAPQTPEIRMRLCESKMGIEQ